MKSKERIEYLDIAKGIAILLIIMGHMSLKHVNSVVFTFHVPIFFIISGYFFTKKYNYKELLSKLFKTLIVPYLVTCLLIIIFMFCRKMISGGVNSLLFSQIYNQILASLYGSGLTSYYFHIWPIGAIWFLLSLFWSKIIFNFLIDKKYKYIYIILIFILGIIRDRKSVV